MNIPSRWCVLAGLLAVSVAGCRDTMPVEAEPGPSLMKLAEGVTFDWTVPARFGVDANGDGLTDYRRTPDELHPSSWPVNLDACQLPPGKKYKWHVDNLPVATVESCMYTHAFPAEGRYEVTLHVVGDRGPSFKVDDVVTVQDWLVVSFGDSYASGEGVPEVAQGTEELLDAINGTLEDLVAAQRNLAGAAASLQEAFERKGLAEAVLADAQQSFNNFLTACTPDNFKAIQQCANFLAGLPFETFDDARNHFNTAVHNAQERLNDLTAAYNQALAAHAAAQSAFTSLQTTIAILRAGLTPPRWQAAYANEDWGSENCHRSALAAPARAARALEEIDPRTSVTFVHLACTGAQVDQFRANLTKQVPWANALVGSREIDAVLVSIGGNDAGFATLATACAVQQPCYVDAPAFDPADVGFVCALFTVVGLGDQCNELFGVFPAQSGKQVLEAGVAALPGKYATLANTLLPGLEGLLAPALGATVTPVDPAERVRSGRVYITEYVDMTKDDARSYCRFDRTDPLGAIPGITQDEMLWLDLTATRSINGAVAEAAATHGWVAVGEIFSAYAPHGYCAEDHWVVRAHETFLRQGDPSGVAHPNVRGHIQNGQAIFAALIGDLYPLGLGAAPRAPDEDDRRPGRGRLVAGTVGSGR